MDDIKARVEGRGGLNVENFEPIKEVNAYLICLEAPTGPG
jgi:hypothetical protein